MDIEKRASIRASETTNIISPATRKRGQGSEFGALVSAIYEQRATSAAPMAGTSTPAEQGSADDGAPTAADFAAPAPAISSGEQQPFGGAPKRASKTTAAGRSPAGDHRAQDGLDAQPAAARAKRRAPPRKEQQARTAAPDVAGAVSPAEQETGARFASPQVVDGTTPLSPAFICAELVALQRRRRFSIKMQSRIDRGLEAALARQIGFRTDLPPAERLKIFRRVAVMRKAIVNGDLLADLSHFEWSVANDWRHEIALTEEARSGWDFQRDKVEQQMRAYAEDLPVWEWAQGIRGFTALGLAVIVGEACGPSAPELGDYRSYQNLCKRLAIGVVDGHRQGSPGTGATADEWIKEGYKKERRAEIWTILDFSLRNAQWRTEGGALGAYGAIYGRQVGVYEVREWKHAKKAAARYMAKCFIRDLYRAWRRYRTESAEGATLHVPEGQNYYAPDSGMQQVASPAAQETVVKHSPPAAIELADHAINSSLQGQHGYAISEPQRAAGYAALEGPRKQPPPAAESST